MRSIALKKFVCDRFVHGSGASGYPRCSCTLIHGQWMPHTRSARSKKHRIDRGQCRRDGDPDPEPPPLQIRKRPAGVGRTAPEVEEDFLVYRRPARVGTAAPLAPKEELDPPTPWRSPKTAYKGRSYWWARPPPRSPVPPSPKRSWGKRKRKVHDLDPKLLEPSAQQASPSSSVSSQQGWVPPPPEHTESVRSKRTLTEPVRSRLI